MDRRAAPGAKNGRGPTRVFRRRAARAPGSRGPHRRGTQARLLHESDHLRCWHGRVPGRGVQGRGARSHPDQLPGQQRGIEQLSRWHRQLRAQVRNGARGQEVRIPDGAEHRHPSPEHRPDRRHHPHDHRSGRGLRRAREHAVLRLVQGECGTAAADTRPAGARGTHRARLPGANEGPDEDHLRRAGLLRNTSQGVHEWLGRDFPHRRAGWRGPALPCGAPASRFRVSERERSFDRMDLERVAGVQSLPRLRMDARTLPQLSGTRQGLRWLPLPGVHDDG